MSEKRLVNKMIRVTENTRKELNGLTEMVANELPGRLIRYEEIIQFLINHWKETN